MMRFEHTIHNPTGIHGRPAREIVKIARQFADTTITVSRAERTVRGDGLLRLMTLGIRTGDRVTVTCEGPDEMAATIAMQNYFWNHL